MKTPALFLLMFALTGCLGDKLGSQTPEKRTNSTSQTDSISEERVFEFSIPLKIANKAFQATAPKYLKYSGEVDLPGVMGATSVPFEISLIKSRLISAAAADSLLKQLGQEYQIEVSAPDAESTSSSGSIGFVSPILVKIGKAEVKGFEVVGRLSSVFDPKTKTLSFNKVNMGVLVIPQDNQVITVKSLPLIVTGLKEYFKSSDSQLFSSSLNLGQIDVKSLVTPSGIFGKGLHAVATKANESFEIRNLRFNDESVTLGLSLN